MFANTHELGRPGGAPHGFGLIGLDDIDNDFGFEVEGVEGVGFIFGKVGLDPSIQIIELLVGHGCSFVLFVMAD